MRCRTSLRGGVVWARVAALADRLDADLSKKVGDLSSGNRQKVGLIQAFMNRPEVLIMDEPSSGLDPLEAAADPRARLGSDRQPLLPQLGHFHSFDVDADLLQPGSW